MIQPRWPYLGEFLGKLGIAATFSAVTTIKGLSVVDQLSNWQTLSSEHRILPLLSDIASVLFLSFVIALAMIRLPPLRTASGMGPRIYALAGTYLLIGLNVVPAAENVPTVATLAGLSLVLSGSLLSIWVLRWLGRSFSIVPTARKLVTNGPYSVVRHPLYITEGMAVLGVVLLHWTLFAALLGGLQYLFQYRRMQLEEKLLSEAFPEYRDYAKRIPRLLPNFRRTRLFV
jgi:protein-S-isoprenylcysteine O-methyltransferase Ste14